MKQIKINFVGDASALSRIADEFYINAVSEILNRADGVDKNRVIDLTLSYLSSKDQSPIA